MKRFKIISPKKEAYKPPFYYFNLYVNIYSGCMNYERFERDDKKIFLVDMRQDKTAS